MLMHSLGIILFCWRWVKISRQDYIISKSLLYYYSACPEDERQKAARLIALVNEAFDSYQMNNSNKSLRAFDPAILSEKELLMNVLLKLNFFKRLNSELTEVDELIGYIRHNLINLRKREIGKER